MDPTAFTHNALVRVGLERLAYATSIDTPGADSPRIVYDSYRDALDHLIPGLSSVTNNSTRQWLQRRIELAMDRAETLQQIARVATPSPPSPSTTTSDRSKRSSSLSPARPIQLEDAVALAQRAAAAETTGDVQAAYDAYRGALEILVPLALPSWQSRVVKYMERAEELATQLAAAPRCSSTTSTSALLTDLQSVTREVSACRQRVQARAARNDPRE